MHYIIKVRCGRLVPAILAVFLFVSCASNHADDRVHFSLSGEPSSLAESDQYVYWVSCENGNDPVEASWYVSSFDKNGKKNWEIYQPTSGKVFPLKDGRFFYAATNGEVTAYEASGKQLFKKQLNLAEDSNFNFFLNKKEDLTVNITSTQNVSTVYCVISINGERVDMPETANLAAGITYNYPPGGYIAEGFTDDGGHTWRIYRFRDDFSVEWTYAAENGDNNLRVSDISPNGEILLRGHTAQMETTFLRKLDPQGNEINDIHFQSPNVTAAYFGDKIVASADKLRVLNSDFTVSAEFDAFMFARIKTFEKSFFVYSPGSYAHNASVVYDGYCRQYDENNSLIFSENYRSSSFTEIGDNGKLYFK